MPDCRTWTQHFLRPGRIDQVIHFPKPDAKLRRQLVLELWHSDIRQAIEIDRVVDETEGLSFADIEELKKLLVLRFLDTQKWDWPWTLRTFRQDDRRGKPVRKVGFVDPRSTDLQTAADPILNEI
jgi:cell division protease FtsH